jgi:hypothetical protein
MNRAVFKDASFKEAVLAFNFEPVPKIERFAYEFESLFRSIFEKEVIVTKVPDDSPPNIPRFVLTSKNRALEVSEVNAVFKINFKEIDSDQAFSLYLEKAKKVFDCIRTAGSIKIESFRSSALFHYSLEDPNYSVGDAIFDRFFKIEKPSDFSSVSFIVSQKIDDILVKNMIDSYETRQKSVKIEAKDTVPGEVKRVYYKFNFAEMEVVDKGLLNRIEIITDEIRKDDLQGVEKLFEKILNWPKQYIREAAEQFIFGGK